MHRYGHTLQLYLTPPGSAKSHHVCIFTPHGTLRLSLDAVEISALLHEHPQHVNPSIPACLAGIMADQISSETPFTPQFESILAPPLATKINGTLSAAGQPRDNSCLSQALPSRCPANMFTLGRQHHQRPPKRKPAHLSSGNHPSFLSSQHTHFFASPVYIFFALEYSIPTCTLHGIRYIFAKSYPQGYHKRLCH